MQKLSVKLKNTPTDTSLVCSSAKKLCRESLRSSERKLRKDKSLRNSVNPKLNRDQSLSAWGKVLSDNNHEGNLPQHTGDQNLRVSGIVYVLNSRGKPLMPTTPRKTKLLLKKEKANVVKRMPFTIRLNYATGENVQEVELGIDSGSKYIGFSAKTETKELISGELELESRMKSRLDDRRMYRRNRRNRLWYRKPRFMNRKTEKGWLPPSIERRYQTHLSLIRKIKSLLPITKVRIEVGNFDIQKLNNPNISGKRYQQGDKFGYENTKAYILAREKYLCQLCGKSVKGCKTNLHHIIERANSGTDKPSNLALLHDKCHEKLHKKGLGKKLKKAKQYKEATFMNVIKNCFQNDLSCELTFGYETFVKRKALGIEKSHVNDAFVIAGGTNQIRVKPFQIIQKRKNNRSLQKNRKGFKPSIRKRRYKIQPKDLVLIDGEWKETSGTHCKGRRIIINKKSININVIEKIFYSKNLIWKVANN